MILMLVGDFYDLIWGLVWFALGVMIASVLFNRERKQSRITEITKMDIEVEAVLYQIEQETAGDRALVLKFHNGGTVIYSGVNKYTSVIAESHSPALNSIRQLVQNFPVDRGYLPIMNKLSIEKQVALDVPQMEESAVRRRYIQDGCKSALLVELIQTESGLYFLDVSSKKENFVMDDTYSKLEQLANRLRNIYRAGKKKQLVH